MGAGIFVNVNAANVPAITQMVNIVVMLNAVTEISFNKYIVDPHIKPTTAALIPSKAR